MHQENCTKKEHTGKGTGNMTNREVHWKQDRYLCASRRSALSKEQGDQNRSALKTEQTGMCTENRTNICVHQKKCTKQRTRRMEQECTENRTNRDMHWKWDKHRNVVKMRQTWCTPTRETERCTKNVTSVCVTLKQDQREVHWKQTQMSTNGANTWTCHKQDRGVHWKRDKCLCASKEVH